MCEHNTRWLTAATTSASNCGVSRVVRTGPIEKALKEVIRDQMSKFKVLFKMNPPIAAMALLVHVRPQSTRTCFTITPAAYIHSLCCGYYVVEDFCMRAQVQIEGLMCSASQVQGIASSEVFSHPVKTCSWLRDCVLATLNGAQLGPKQIE
eukprot:COSAG05_NODE_1337_length_5147_cov_25.636485_6_plen_151_part_00